jgi:hypothetical protein
LYSIHGIFLGDRKERSFFVLWLLFKEFICAEKQKETSEGQAIAITM